MGRHLLHVIDSLDPAAGGVSEAVKALLEFQPEGYSAEVVCLDETGAGFLQGYEAVGAAAVTALGRGRGPVGYNGALDKWLRGNRGRFDGVLVHGLWRYVGFAAWRAFRGRTPYVVLPHGMLDPYFKRRFPLKHAAKWPYWLLSEYHLLRDALWVVFTTGEESRLAEESFFLHRWRAFVVALGATVPVSDAGVELEAFFERVPEVRGRRFLLFLGRIHRKKGCDLLVEAFARIAGRDQELELVMAGPDQQGWAAELRASAEAAGVGARVHWPGMLTGEVKWGAFRACEAFVLPSHQENFGIAVAEAMGCGKAVLLSDQVNIAPAIAEDGAGLMESDTLAGTERLLERWVELSQEARAGMEERALQCFEARYDMRRNAGTVLRLFEGE